MASFRRRTCTTGIRFAEVSRRLAIAADHAGAALKAAIVARVAEIAPDWSVADLGGDGSDPTDDYPDSARAVAERMIAGQADRGGAFFRPDEPLQRAHAGRAHRQAR